ncbi:MAG: methyltransferase domain-containing protein [archaeon]
MNTVKPKYPYLNLGSGFWYREGWINIDVDPKWKPDILCDVENGIPLEDNSIEKVYIKHVLEHIQPKKFAYVIQEIHRICKNKAKIKIWVPYFSCSITYKTPDHMTHMSYYTFDNSDEFRVLKKKLHFFRKSFGYESKAITAAAKILNPILSFLPNAFPLIYERFFCWIFPVEEIEVLMEVSK